MKIKPVFSDVEKNCLEKIQNAFGSSKIEKICVVSNKRNVGGGYDHYTSIRFYISFRNGIELSREDYKTIDTLFPSHEENGYLLAAYEYNPYDISPKEEMRIWVPLS